jgi:nitrate reductase NapE component
MATLAALQTQEKNSADAQAAATAEIMRANAQATLNASGATLSAALTQEQNNVNIIAAQVEATAAIVRANAQATLVAAGSTQNAAQTQDAIRQTQVQFSLQMTADLATQNAIAAVTQQNNNLLAGSTQTAVADHIATQTQSAVATTQWYTDQERQRAEQRQGPLTFLWLWCPPFLIVAVALVGLWFFWRWMKIRETQQRIDLQPAIIVSVQPKSTVSTPLNLLAKPTDNVRKWLEEVKRKLLANQKDDDDQPDS